MKSYVKKNNFSLFGPKNVTSRNILTQNIGLASPYVHELSAPWDLSTGYINNK